jgi:hypothetical protein
MIFGIAFRLALEMERNDGIVHAFATSIDGVLPRMTPTEQYQIVVAMTIARSKKRGRRLCL